MRPQADIVREFLVPDPNKDGENYLQNISEVVSKLRGLKIAIKDESFRVGSFKDTSYQDEPDMLEEWEQFYLPDHVKMNVIGVLENFYCNEPNDELVLMVCEDGKVFGFEDMQLHLVADRLEELFKKGVQFPGTEHYYNGERFKKLGKQAWDRVNASEEVTAVKMEHEKLQKDTKESYLKSLAVIKQRLQKAKAQSSDTTQNIKSTCEETPQHQSLGTFQKRESINFNNGIQSRKRGYTHKLKKYPCSTRQQRPLKRSTKGSYQLPPAMGKQPKGLTPVTS